MRLNLARLRRTVSRHLENGWSRAVFARPRVDGRPEAEDITVEGPGDLTALLERAEDAARRGFVKHTYVVDEHRRIRVDARDGRGRVQAWDAATLAKAMGGKDRPLRPDRSGALLRAIGIMNADGSISARNAKKYKQVNHLVELCRPVWERLDTRPLRVLDLACGNSYLTFVLAEALRLADVPALLHGIDTREDVVGRSRERAEALGLDNVTFERGEIASVQPSGVAPDLVVALHACDTATDDALAFAIRHRAPAIMAAPCCQRELATQLERNPESAVLPALRRGMLLREYAAVLTDALRFEVLDASGYATDAVEFVASQHTPKNLLLRAHRRTAAPAPRAMEEVLERCAQLGVAPRLVELVSRAEPGRDPR